MAGRSRAWCFTMNNPIEPLDEDDIAAEYLIYQLEMGEEGTPHFQGLVYFSSVKSFSQVISLFPGAHIECCRAIVASIAYCSKEDTRLEGPYEYGVRPHQGARSDLAAAIEDVVCMKSMAEVAAAHPSVYVRYHRGLQAYRTVTAIARSEITECVSIFGPTGTGKTYQARIQFPTAFWKNKGEWWDGYDGQEDVVIDEFYGWLPLDFMLRLLDCTPLLVPTKGGFVNFVAKRVIILSNKQLENWYPNHKDMLPSLRRRIVELEKLTLGGDIVPRTFPIFH